MQCRTIRPFLVFVTVMVYHLLTSSPSQSGLAAAATISPSPTQQNATTAAFEWKNWDFYRLLGLDRSSSASITAQDIRKAYRSQAKRYHPDKVVSSSNSNSSSEETNARFARIAEAYQVLSNDETRAKYDHSLLSRQSSQKTYDDAGDWLKYDRGRGADADDYMWHVDLQDAWRIFEDMFEQSFDFSVPHFASTSSFFEDFHHQHSPPIATQEEFYYFDMLTGAEILRVVQTFENPDDDSIRGRRRRRVSVTQDFVEEWNPFQHRFVYRPISEPWQQQEEEQPYHYNDYSRNPPKQSKQQQQYHDLYQIYPDCILWSHQSMFEGSFLEQPPLRAGLVGCELQILHDGMILWSSSNSERIPSSWMDSCRVQLQGSQLIVVSTSTGWLYWSSEPDEQLELGSSSNNYMARLDKDATLCVYRISNEPDPPAWMFEIMRLLFPLSVLSVPPNMNNLLHQDDQERILLPWQLTCVYSTGPARCNRMGRVLVHAFRKLVRLFQWWLLKLDQFFDSM